MKHFLMIMIMVLTLGWATAYGENNTVKLRL